MSEVKAIHLFYLTSGISVTLGVYPGMFKYISGFDLHLLLILQ